jgi:hypothetical protein
MPLFYDKIEYTTAPTEPAIRFVFKYILIIMSCSLTLYYFVNMHMIAVLYQFHLYNLSHLLSVASSGGIFFTSLTHDLIVQTVKMISEREKLSSLKNPCSVSAELPTPEPTTEQHLSMLLCNEVSTLASSLLSKFDSYLIASDFAQNKCSGAFNISWTHSTGTSKVEQLDLELKWMYFEKVLQVIQNKLHADPVSMDSAHEVELIIQSKLLHGNFDFSNDRDVLTFIGALKWYVQMVRISCVGSRRWQINEMRQSIMHELETITAQLEINATEVQKKVADISKNHVRAQIRVSSIRQRLDSAIALQKDISDFQSRISMYVKHLVVDLGQAQKESVEMRARHQDVAQLAEGVFIQLRKKAELHKKKLCAQLGDLKHSAQKVLTIQEQELQDLVGAILITKVEKECDSSVLESAPSGFYINSCFIKKEAV